MASDIPRLSIGRRVLFSAVTTVILLAGVEAGFRAAGYGQRVIAVPDANTGHSYVPGQDRVTERGNPIHINAHGLRDEEFPRDKPEGEFRVLILGDSLTFGNDVDQDDVFPRLLHDRLGERCERPVRVINGGVQGFDTSQERDFLLVYGLELDPDLVVVAFYPNDVEMNTRRPAPVEFPGRNLLRRSAVFEFVERDYIAREARRMGEEGIDHRNRSRQLEELMKRYTGTVAINPSNPEDRELVKVVTGLLVDMARVCHEREIGFAVAMLPGFANTEDPTLPNIMAGLSWELGQKGIKSANLVTALKDGHPDVWLAHDPGHFSVKGHQMTAGALETWLTASKMIPGCE